MMRMEPVSIGGRTALAVEVKLPKTTLLAVTTDKGYIMCGALDVGLLNEKIKRPWNHSRQGCRRKDDPGAPGGSAGIGYPGSRADGNPAGDERDRRGRIDVLNLP